MPREPPTTYNPLLSILNLQTSEHRRHDLSNLYKLLAGNVDFSDFLNRLTFYTHAFSTRSTNTFRLSLQVVQITLVGNRVMQTVNKLKKLFSSPNLFSFELYCNYLTINS